MSQQQDSQGSSGQSEEDEEQYTSSSSWLTQGKNKGYKEHEAPKSEHPSTYDDSIPPLSYQAQDTVQTSSTSAKTKKSSTQKPQKNFQSSHTGPGSDADAFETTYRPYSQYTGRWQVPPWARPQQNNAGTLWLLMLFIASIVLLPALCVVIRVVTLSHIAPLLFFLVPFIIIGALLLGFTLLAILSNMGKIKRIKPPFWW